MNKIEKNFTIGFAGSRDISTIYNHRCIQLLFRDMFSLAYSAPCADMYAALILTDDNGCNALIQEEANTSYPIETTVYSVGKPKNHTAGGVRNFKTIEDMESALVDDCNVLIVIRINGDERISEIVNRSKSMDKDKRVLLIDLE